MSLAEKFSESLLFSHLADGHKAYVYHFTQRPSFSKDEKWIKASHADELAYLFWDEESGKCAMSPEELALAKRMRAYWCSFAKDGYVSFKLGYVSVKTGQTLREKGMILLSTTFYRLKNNDK